MCAILHAHGKGNDMFGSDIDCDLDARPRLALKPAKRRIWIVWKEHTAEFFNNRANADKASEAYGKGTRFPVIGVDEP